MADNEQDRQTLAVTGRKHTCHQPEGQPCQRCADFDRERRARPTSTGDESSGLGQRPCADPGCSTQGEHVHDETGRVLWRCSWHPSEFHNICSEACN